MILAVFRPLAVALCLGCTAVAAWGADPLETDWLLPLKPSPALAGRVADAPCATALPATPLSVVDAVDLALCNHPQTREVWASARAQAATLGVARSAWLPGLDGQVSAGRSWSEGVGASQRSAALTLSWLVYDFGAREAGVEGARQLLAAAAATQDATVQSLFLSALSSYYAAQASRAAVAAAKEAERAANESLQAAEARYRVGVATPADRLQARTAASQATLNRIRADGGQQNAVGALANALGFDAHQPIVLAAIPEVTPDAGFEGDVAALIDEARRRRPDLKAAEAQVAAAQAGVESARAAGRPTLSLAAGPSWQRVAGAESDGGAIGLSLNVPLFTGFATTYRVRAAEAQAEVKAAQRDRLARQVALEVWQNRQNLATATQSIQTAADLVASAEASERVALGRYKAGVGNILDLLNAQSALAAARQQRIQATLDWQVSRAALAQSLGALDYSLLEK